MTATRGDRLRWWLWTIFVVCVLGPIVFIVNAEGIRQIDVFATKFSKFLPIGQYQGWRRLDVAHVVAVVILMAVWFFLHQMLKYSLGDESAFDDKGHDPVKYKRFMFMVGVPVVVLDLAAFYFGVAKLSWGSTGFSFKALGATAIYLCVLLFVAVVSLNVSMPFKKER